eukprot:6115158-Pleurochrysis_carterae.AAC.1
MDFHGRRRRHATIGGHAVAIAPIHRDDLISQSTTGGHSVIGNLAPQLRTESTEAWHPLPLRPKWSGHFDAAVLERERVLHQHDALVAVVFSIVTAWTAKPSWCGEGESACAG